ncbi:hypothetical protein HQ560_04180, partial [bacterium]|nr:hypothetical protein [bacterium]
RFSIPYWDKLDAVIQHAAKLGVIVELTVFDETGLSPSNGDPWARHPFHRANGGPIDARAGSPGFYDVAAKATLAAQEAYVGYLLARTAAYSNVVYELNNEMNRRNSARQFGLRWAEHWAAFLREHDPFDHLVSLSVAENGQAYFLIQGIDVANVHGKEPPEPQGIRIPVVFNEPYVKTPREERGAFWRSLLVGVSASRAPWQSLTERTEIFEHVRYLADYARDLRAWELRPDDSVVLAVPGGVRAHTSVRNGEVLSYLVGSTEGGAVRVGLRNGRYDAEWFDPKNGVVRLSEEVEPARGVAELTCPTFDEDIVLRVRKK